MNICECCAVKSLQVINVMTSLQGGDNAGEISRAVMRSVMTNNCMSQFSGTGQKGKMAFIGTPLYKIILSAARKASKKTVSFEIIKREVLDVLRFAPYLPGGTNYAKKKAGKKSIQIIRFRILYGLIFPKVQILFAKKTFHREERCMEKQGLPDDIRVGLGISQIKSHFEG
ncbi:uncharacterized protein LOC125663661 [Ostrea edulis]|uniref:uncharacterized protein LOC125663661 n=1 Tax=Ostrea edulis TaxID=37623 RepID=UPI0024AEC284|nr:uncharacterized protein LOC125663661 [Ostrea edulis]